MAVPLPEVEGVEHQEVVVRGLRLHVAVAGPPGGRPVVLQHGFPQHWYEWRHLFRPLADADCRVVAPDFRGFGWSEYPPDEDFLKETLVDDLVALCGELGHDRVAFVGHDWGGWVGWLLCLRRPELVERALFLSAPPPFPPERLTPADLVRLRRLWYQLVIGSPLSGPPKMAFFRGILTAARRDAWEPGVLGAYLDPLRQPAQTRAGTLLYRQFVLREIPALLGGRYRGGRLTMPVRFLIGRHDLLFHDQVVEEAAPHADDYTGEALDGVGHFVPEEAPDVVRERLVELLGDRRL